MVKASNARSSSAVIGLSVKMFSIGVWGPRSYDKTGLWPASVYVLVLQPWSWSYSGSSTFGLAFNTVLCPLHCKEPSERIMYIVIVISLSTVEYTSVSRVYSTVDSDITNLIHGPCRLSGVSSGCWRLIVCVQSSVKKVLVNARGDIYRISLKLTWRGYFGLSYNC